MVWLHIHVVTLFAMQNAIWVVHSSLQYRKLISQNYRGLSSRGTDSLSPVNPQSPEILFGELHDCVKPIPKGEGAIRQWLLAELGPAHQRGGEVVVVAVTSVKGFVKDVLLPAYVLTFLIFSLMFLKHLISMFHWPESLSRQEPEVVLVESPPTRRLELHVQGVGQLAPRNLGRKIYPTNYCIWCKNVYISWIFFSK